MQNGASKGQDKLCKGCTDITDEHVLALLAEAAWLSSKEPTQPAASGLTSDTLLQCCCACRWCHQGARQVMQGVHWPDRSAPVTVPGRSCFAEQSGACPTCGSNLYQH